MAAVTETTTIRSGSDYQDCFDPKAYLKYAHVDENPIFNFCLPGIQKLVAERTIRKGSRLLDMGSGPSIVSAILAGANCEEIVNSEFSEANRKEVQSWLNAENGAFDWRPIIEYVCKLEGNGDNWEKRQSHIRKALKQVVPCDVHLSNPLAPLNLGQFDVMTSFLVLDAACSERQVFKKTVKNIISLLKPGGLFLYSGVHGCTFYTVGKEKFIACTTDEEFIKEAFSEAGLVDIRFVTEEEGSHCRDVEFNDYTVAFCVSAIKQ